MDGLVYYLYSLHNITSCIFLLSYTQQRNNEEEQPTPTSVRKSNSRPCARALGFLRGPERKIYALKSLTYLCHIADTASQPLQPLQPPEDVVCNKLNLFRRCIYYLVYIIKELAASIVPDSPGCASYL